MIRPRAQLAALVTCAFLPAVAAGCGSEEEEPQGEPLPREATTQLTKRLDEVQRRFDVATEEGKVGACKDIEDDSYPVIDETVGTLPPRVDRDVREALEASVVRLKELTREGCSKAEATATEQQTTPEPEPEPEPPPITQPPPPPQTNTETQPEETTPEEPDKEDEKPKGKGKGPGGAGPPGQRGGGTASPSEDD